MWLDLGLLPFAGLQANLLRPLLRLKSSSIGVQRIVLAAANLTASLVGRPLSGRPWVCRSSHSRGGFRRAGGARPVSKSFLAGGASARKQHAWVRIAKPLRVEFNKAGQPRECNKGLK